MLRLLFAFSLAIGCAHTSQAQELKTKPELLTQCLQQKKPEFHKTCIGVMANDCMTNNDGGGTTVGMGYCTDSELNVWDARLNSVYKKLVALEKANDKEAEKEGWNAPKKFPPLKDMQRKWIPYRDAMCDYEYSQWGGGTGGGPAILSCLMGETARQTLLLESYLRGWEG